MAMLYRFVLVFGRLPILKIGWALTVFIGFACLPPLQASPVASISLKNPPVWVQRDNLKSDLANSSLLKSGDHIVTGVLGRIEMYLEAGVALQLFANTDIQLLDKSSPGATIFDDRADLYIITGRICITLGSPLKPENGFKLGVDNNLFLTIRHVGHFCVSRQDGQSLIELVSGSVHITRAISSDSIVLSEAGTKIRIKDNGSYDWNFPDSGDSSRLENDEAAVNQKETLAGQEVRRIQDDKLLAESKEFKNQAEVIVKTDKEAVTTDKVGEKQLSIDGEKSAAATYSVYLFSTRSEDVAKQANRKFRAVGYSTQIKVHESEEETRYRIAVTGFKSRQSAKDFSSAIVGKLGVTETWIGKSL